MPERFGGFYAPRYTQVPDQLFDELLPDLSGAELKVLLYIIRRTFGFKKDSDDISIRQLTHGIVTRDGRRLDRGAGVSETSVLRAVQGLTDKGIVLARRNQSRERGDEATTYQLQMRDSPPVPQSGGRPSLKVEPPRPPKRGTQETVEQETEGQETSTGRPADAGEASQDEEARSTIAAFVEDFGREFGDTVSAARSTGRALKLYRAVSLPLSEFSAAMYQARVATKGHSPNGHKMAYWFACLEGLVEK